MKHSTHLEKRTMTVCLAGELDEYAAEPLRRSLDVQLEQGGFDVLIFDLKGLSFMDSTGIGMLIGRYKRMHKKGVRVYLKNACVQVEKVLRMTGIYDIMPKLTEDSCIVG